MSYLRSIYARELTFFWSMPWEMWPEVNLKHFSNQKNIFWGARKAIRGPKRGTKRPICVSYELNLTI